ncbi:MAG: CpaE family protein [Chloroflexia bacterium]
MMTRDFSHFPLVVIVDSNEVDRITTREFLLTSGEVYVAGVAGQVAELSRFLQADPDIVLLGAGTGGGGALKDVPAMVREVRGIMPRCDVILLADPGAGFDVSEAMLAGVRGVVPKPVASEQLLKTVRKVFDSEQAKQRHVEETQAAGTERPGEIIVLYSPKGGVGCTTIATNLALALQRETHARVALVDFDLQFGDVDILLDLRPGHGVHELTRSTNDLDASILEAVMLKHQSGLSVLLPPPTLDQVELLSPEGLIAVLKALRKYYDYVIVDTWHAIEEITLELMDLSNVLLLVTTPEIPSVTDTKRIVDLLHGRPGYAGKIQVVVNRYPSRGAIDLQQVERSLGMKPVATIPSDGHLMTDAINEGVSVLFKPSNVATNLAQLGALLAQPRMAKTGRSTGSGPAPAKKRPLLSLRRTENRNGTEQVEKHRNASVPTTERA